MEITKKTPDSESKMKKTASEVKEKKGIKGCLKCCCIVAVILILLGIIASVVVTESLDDGDSSESSWEKSWNQPRQQKVSTPTLHLGEIDLKLSYAFNEQDMITE